MLLSLIGGDIRGAVLSDDAVWRLTTLTSVGLSRKSGLSREQRDLGRPKLAQR